MQATKIETSINLMKTELRFSICNLETSYIANKDVHELSQKIRSNLPESLAYSCLYWITHLTGANQVTVEVLVPELFQSPKAIYWVEVLSLVDGLKVGLEALQSVMVFFKVSFKQCVHVIN